MSIDSIIAKINKEFGDETIIKGEQLRTQKIERVTTGSLAFDLALGGGWPLNQWHEIIGLESSGKTVTVLKTIAANQILDKNYRVVWVAAEAIPMEWVQRLGVDLKRFILVNTSLAEEALQAVIDFVSSREVDCIIIDSLPALLPNVEDEGSMDELQVAALARVSAKFFRKGSKGIKRSLVHRERPVLGIIINQWRSQIGVTHGDPRTTPGGLAKNYFFFTRTEIRRTEWLEVNKLRIGQRIGARVIKNKSAPGQRLGEFDFYFAEGGPVGVGDYDTLAEVVNLGIATNAIERRGRYYDFAGERIADGREALFNAVRERDDLADKIRRLVLYGEAPVIKDPPKKTTKRRVREKRG